MNRPAWLDRLPSGWKATPLRHAAVVQNSNVDKKSYEDGIPVRLCNYTDVYYNEYIRPDMDLMKATATPKEVAKFELRSGDVIITKDSESWDDIAVPACVPEDMPGVVCGYHLTMLRPLASMDGRFLLRALQSEGVKEQFWLAANGVTRFGIGQQGMKDALIPEPPLSAQRAIADFLDRKTAAIDALIEKKERLLELLAEKRAALIHRAVTKGLDPDVPMKDSGVPWIGEIPARWVLTAVKRACSSVRDGTHGPPPRFPNGDHRLLSARNIQNGRFVLRDDDRRMSPEAFAELERSYTVREGDVVLASVGATTGKSAVVGPVEKVSVQRSLAILRPDQSRLLSDYLHMWLDASVTQHAIQLKASQYAAQGGIYLEDVANLSLVLPSRPEQVRILDATAPRLANMRRMAASLDDSCTRLREYRQALITAAVTGQLDIPGAE